jgi:PAS domain S-box-containing protein
MKSERSALSIDLQGRFDSVKLGVAIGIVYFMAALLGLDLRAETGFAVFWPASGIAVGALIVLGHSKRLPVAAGVFVAAIACNLMIGRSVWLSFVFGLLNAGQPLFTVWLLERFWRTFRLEDVQRVLGFFAATTVGSAIAALGAAVAISFAEPTSSPVHAWRLWFAACSLGIVTVTPLLMGLGDVMRERLPRHELIEGWGSLVMLTALSTFLISLPDGPWASALPEALVFPFLLCIAMRCRPVFAAAAALLVGLIVIGSTTLSIGNFDSGKPLADRILSAQTFVLAAAILVVLLAAVFAERRDHLTALETSNHRLQLALDCAELGTWSLHLKSGRFENDVRDRRIHGYVLEAQPTTLEEMRAQVHPDDISKLDAAFGELGRTGGNCRTEYRLAPRTDQERAGRERWVTLEGTVLRRANGRAEQLLGVTHDITERKHAEEALRQREAELSEAQRLAHIGSWYWKAKTDVPVVSDELLRIFGADPATQRVPTLCDQRGRWYPVGDWKRLKAAAQRTMQTGVGYELELQAFRNEIPIWITARGAAVHNSKGQVVGLRGTVQDITERKRAEQALSERNAQLALAAKAALVGSYEYDVETRMLQFSEGYAAVYDLPEGMNEMTGSQRRALVHPEDLQRLDRVRSQAFEQRRSEFEIEYRNILPKRGVRWIESRSLIFYDSDGRPQRLVGVNIDVTERKRAEERQRALVAELDHRVKNALATVSSIVSHTGVGSRSVASFVASLEGRLRSLASTHDLLSAGRWQGISLTQIIRRELAPYVTRHNTRISGPEVTLKPEPGQAMAMVLHELATNAAKYGAFSTEGGRVSIWWGRQMNGHPPRLVLEWQEIGGPPVVATDKSSFGTSTIRDLIPYEFGGTVDLVFAPEGARCRLALPADWLSNDRELGLETSRGCGYTRDADIGH